MSLSSEQIDRIVTCPSVGAVTYQACALIRELEGIHEIEYLPQACRIRDVYLCITEYILTELWDLQNLAESSPNPPESVLARVRGLGAVLHEVHAYIRYLRASSPRQSPPGVQVALAQLTKLYFPSTQAEPVCLVRPQWKYNLTYVPMSWYLKELLKASVLDPTNKLGATNSDEMLQRLWERSPRKFEQKLPTQLAILSFPGLDTHDTLLYPLLAHELGHFIDFSHDPPLNLRPDLRQKAEIRQDQVKQLLLGAGLGSDPQIVSSYLNILVQQVYIAIREIIADLLATRMLGLSQFVAQAEFLKTLARWPQDVITTSGYPGLRFRLQVIFEHLEKWLPNSCFDFFVAHKSAKPDIAGPMLEFLEKWRHRLNSPTAGAATVPSLQTKLGALVENAVRAILPDLHELAKLQIPANSAARLSDHFFDRVERLHEDLPPSFPRESLNSFAEILSAGWTYQIIYGEGREAARPEASLQFEEYKKTCRLILKAIELTTTAADVDSSALNSFPTVSDEVMTKGGVLGGPHIVTRIKLPLRDPRHLSITPLDASSVKSASLEVHLGNWFVVAKRTRVTKFELGDEKAEKHLRDVARELVFVPPDGTFIIHPGDLVLGVTMEFIALPTDVMAFVEGRSGLGRLGLIVATATQVAPGFHGVVVLEMANAGTVPLELRPQLAVAQLVLLGMSQPVPEDQLYRGRYYCQVIP